MLDYEAHQTGEFERVIVGAELDDTPCFISPRIGSCSDIDSDL